MIRSAIYTRILLSTILVFVFINVSGQKESQKSIINIGVGVGPEHGIIGTKTIIGKNGTGFLLGLGGIKGQLTYTLGGQLCVNWFCASVCYGATTVMKDLDNQVTGINNGWSFLTGGRVNLDKKKVVYLEFGLGITTGVPNMNIAPVGDLGLGFRLGSVKSKEKVMNL